MGANLARNLADKKVSTVVFNRTSEKTDDFIKEFGGNFLSGEKTLKKFVASLALPRKIIILVKAGPAVDEVIAELLTLLDKNDILLDLGNSHYKDTWRRQDELQKKQIQFIGCGISGGEQGALHGPSLMPGGEKSAYKKVEKILQKIAAKDGGGGKCVSYIGPQSSGHFVKMVHNGIEYGIMQLIAESYDILKNVGKLSNDELAKVFAQYNKNSKSFLLEITAKIFQKTEGKKHLIDLIKDVAGQKGTGKWTTEEAHNFGVPITTINAAVDARIISGDIPSRIYGPKMSKISKSKIKLPTKPQLIEMVGDALEITTLLAYLQGFNLIRAAAKEYNWNLDTSDIARIWKNGCIIRSQLLHTLEKLFTGDDKISKTPMKKVTEILNGKIQKNWRKLMCVTTNEGIPTPALSASLAHFDSFLRKNLPQNLIQAQRDFFGAHGYERTDKNGVFHTEWE